MSDSYLEVELRYKVMSVADCLQRLEKLGIKVNRTEHLVDEWYEPVSIKSLKEQRTWFDTDHGIAWRIRRSENGDGKQELSVESKQLTDDDNHNSFHETTATFADYETAVEAMDKRSYRNWLTIDKTRYFLTSSNPSIVDDEFELVLDEIEGLAEKIGVGACLEIEHKGVSGREQALQKITEAARLLGFDEKDRFEKSLTVVSMTELARF